MGEALRAVKTSLGPDALILQTRSVPDGNGPVVEVTAIGEKVAAYGGGKKAQEENPVGLIREFHKEIATLKSMLCWIFPSLPQKGVMGELVAQGLSPDVVMRLAQETHAFDGTDDCEKVYHALTRLIPAGGQVEAMGEKRKQMVFIGPAGVGKSSTVVKLTVRMLEREDFRVGWVCLNGDRIVGGAQADVYAGILGVPYEKVEDREGLEEALDRLSGCDLVLIDTPGVSPRGEEIEELAEWIQGIPDLKRVLLLSASTNPLEMQDWVGLYSSVGFDSLIFTKLDECRHFGPLINIALSCGRPLSYITMGQSAVNDLEAARPEFLASLILSGLKVAD